MSTGSPQASPYAAPNTPIASSKRARVSKRGGIYLEVHICF
jgi:hypothetical protein